MKYLFSVGRTVKPRRARMLVDEMPLGGRRASLKILDSAGAPVAQVRGAQPIGCQNCRTRFLELSGGGRGGQPIVCQEF